MYGRDDAEWDELVSEGHRFLREVAGRGRLTSYTELNAVLIHRTGLRGFDFSQKDGRAAMGELLGRIVAQDQQDHPGLMISALVAYLNENNAGAGFYDLAQHNGLLPHGASPQSKERFWIEQVRANHAAHGRGRPSLRDPGEN